MTDEEFLEWIVAEKKAAKEAEVAAAEERMYELLHGLRFEAMQDRNIDAFSSRMLELGMVTSCINASREAYNYRIKLWLAFEADHRNMAISNFLPFEDHDFNVAKTRVRYWTKGAIQSLMADYGIYNFIEKLRVTEKPSSSIRATFLSKGYKVTLCLEVYPNFNLKG